MDRFFTKILGNYIFKNPGPSNVVEQANYSKIRELGDIEIRRYPPLIIAKVEGQKDDAFNILFRFINGGNRRNDKVPMTASELHYFVPTMKLGAKGIFSMLYNAPYVPWFLRKNEVAVEVDSP